MTSTGTEAHPALGASFIALAGGLWLLISPLIYTLYGSSGAWNDCVVGALIFVAGLIRFNRPELTRLSWLNSLLAVWILASPWVVGYTRSTGLLINSLFVGVIVFCAALAGANSERMSHDLNSTT